MNMRQDIQAGARVIAIFLLHACVGAVVAQTAAPVIDGQLDDPLWQTVPAHRLEATQDGQTLPGGEIRAVIRGRHLLISARLPEPNGRVTARLTGRHPSWEDEDMLEIIAGPDIGYTDRRVRINPFGAFTVEREGQEVYANADRYLIATSVLDNEWIVEAALPLNEVSAPGPDTVRASIQRIRAMRQGSPQQRWRWPRQDPSTSVAVDRSAPWDTPAPDHRPGLLGNQEPPLLAGNMAVPPLDAKWDDASWREVPVWTLRQNSPGTPHPRHGTEIRAVHDGKTFAVFARMEEPGPTVARVKEHDERVETDDSFHVYVGTTGAAWAQISVNALGVILDVAGKTGGPRISRPRADWESQARVAVDTAAGFWTVRLDIPLAEVLNILGSSSDESELRVLFARFRPGRNGELSETSVTSAMPGQTLAAPIRYRRLQLSAKAPATIAAAGEISVQPAVLDTAVWTPEQRKAKKPFDMLNVHIRGRVQRALESEARAWAAVKTRQEWEAFRSQRLQALSSFIGKLPDRVSLDTTVAKEYLGTGYRRLDIVYRSRPDLWIAANLYLPLKVRGRVPGIIIIPSHHRPRTQAELQDMGILWARAGSVVLIADNIGHGERIQTYPWNREGYHARYNLGLQLYAAGESLMKWMVWDNMRGVDLLLERAEVDPQKIILLGAVAGGGDPAAVTAALDSRIAAVAPFGFGEATPENAGRGAWPEGLADPGWGSWESTRNMPGSIAGQFLPWFVCASVAPRRFIFSYEMGWDAEKQPVWQRYRRVFGLYGALDHLDEAHGFGGFPGPGECANIGPSQRRTLYPELQRWFGIPAPAEEPGDRRTEGELLSYTPALAGKAVSRPVHALAHDIAGTRLAHARKTLAALDERSRVEWLRKEWSRRLGDVQPNVSPIAPVARKQQLGGVSVESVSVEVESGISVPLLFLRPTSATGKHAAVVAVSHSGKEGLWRDHRAEILKLVGKGVAVCLPDLRGIGETAPDLRRGPMSSEISLAATELMLGNSLLGARLKDLRTVLAYLRNRPDVDSKRMALWGESEAPVNRQRLLADESPGWQIGPDVQHECDPVGGLLTVFGMLFESELRTGVTRRGLSSFESILDDAFAYIPGHVIVPDLLGAGDLSDIIDALPAKSLLRLSAVNAKNQPVATEDRTTDPSDWLAAHLAR